MSHGVRYHTIFTFDCESNHLTSLRESCCQQARRSWQAFDVESSRSQRESAQLKAMTDSQLTVTRRKILAYTHAHTHKHVHYHGVILENMLMTSIYSWHDSVIANSLQVAKLALCGSVTYLTI